jgi:hypothetical protein
MSSLIGTSQQICPTGRNAILFYRMKFREVMYSAQGFEAYRIILGGRN